MYFWRGDWVHSRFFQKLTIFLQGAMERGRQGREGGPGSLCQLGRSSSAWGFQHLQAVADLGLMLSTTADSTAPAALAPSISTCSTCKGDQLTGPPVRLLGPRPAPPLPHHSLQELACLGGSHHIFPKMLQPRETWTSQDCPRWASEAGGSPFLQEATWAPSSLPPSEPFSPGSACSVTLRWARPLSPLFYIKGAQGVGRGAPLDTGGHTGISFTQTWAQVS